METRTLDGAAWQTGSVDAVSSTAAQNQACGDTNPGGRGEGPSNPGHAGSRREADERTRERGGAGRCSPSRTPCLGRVDRRAPRGTLQLKEPEGDSHAQ